MFYILTQEENNALARIQNKRALGPVLALPRGKGHLTLDEEAGDKQVGCV